MIDLVLDLVGVNGLHDEFSEIIVVGDGPAGFVRLEQKRKKICEGGIIKVGVTTGAVVSVRPLEVSCVRLVVNQHLDRRFVGVPLDRNVVAAERGDDCLQEGRPVCRVSTNEVRHARKKRYRRGVDTSDVLDG